MTETINVGAEAPDFELRDQHGQSHRLSSYRGQKNVVLVFYPFAFTGVCTGEMDAIRDDVGSLQNEDTQVFAISCDTVASLRVFAESAVTNVARDTDFGTTRSRKARSPSSAHSGCIRNERSWTVTTEAP